MVTEFWRRLTSRCELMTIGRDWRKSMKRKNKTIWRNKSKGPSLRMNYFSKLMRLFRNRMKPQLKILKETSTCDLNFSALTLTRARVRI